MSTPEPPLFDVGNTLLASVTAQLHTGSITGPQGKIGVATIRTPSTTLTVFLGASDLRTWAGLLTGLADELSGGLAQASAADIAVLNGIPERFRR